MSCLSSSSASWGDVVCLSHGPAAQREKLNMQVVSEEEMQQRLSDLKREIGDAKVDWYVVPSEDDHQSEFVSERDERRKWISGFTGSAGTAIIPFPSTSGSAILFADSRYWVQAEQQIPKSGWTVFRVGANGGSGPAAVAGSWSEWLVQNAGEGLRIGIDPRLLSYNNYKAITSRLSTTSSKLVSLTFNLIDKINPPIPRMPNPLVPHPLKFSGESTPSKLSRLRAHISLSAHKRYIYILPTLPANAWLLNYRCPGDVPFVPVAYAYAIVTEERCIIFVDTAKVGQDLRDAWESEGVEVREYGVKEVGKAVKELQSGLTEKKEVAILGPKECSWEIARTIEPASLTVITCPVDALKSVKNPVEQQGFRNAYLRDGRAMVRWMARLEGKILKEKRAVGEWAAAATLTRFRREEENFAGLAYGDISGSGPNGALPHYEPELGKDRVIDLVSPYVIDSGAQYLDGTIDTTRTLFFGGAKDATEEMRRAYTRVLQGHMACQMTNFPKGMNAEGLNFLARKALYEDGLNFGHGTGHGVGSYLVVHESPPGLGGAGSSLEPGQVVTIEPGFYKEGEFGIRTESLVLCKTIDTKYDFGGKAWLGFERITQVPIQTTLIEWSLMSKVEIRWINDHNKAVQDALSPLLQEERDGEARDWLKRVCKSKKVWPWMGK